MKQFKIFQNKTNPIDFKVIKIGFSWPALLFGILWVLYKRMWWIAAAIVLTHILIVFMVSTFVYDKQIVDLTSTIVGWTICTLLGFKGNELYESYISKNYKWRDTIPADNTKTALTMYLIEKRSRKL